MSWEFSKKENSCIDDCPEMKSSVKIFLKKKAEDQIKKLCEKFPSLEWMAGLKGEEKEGEYTIEELIVFDQEVESAHVEHTPEGDQEFAKHKFIGWIHSHNMMPASHSATDVTTANQQAISMTVNNAFDFATKVKKEMSCGRKTLVDGEVLLERAELEVDETWLKEALEKIKERPKTVVKYQSKSAYNWEKKGNEFCPVCLQGMNKRKAIQCPICQEYVHNKCYDFRSDMCETCSEVNTEDPTMYRKEEARPYEEMDT